MPRQYTIHAHPTTYAGVRFRSRLEARWAAFFDLCQWAWEYEPIELAGWAPDFYVHFRCGHSECPNGHRLYVEVKPYHELEDFADHPAWSMIDGDYAIRPAVFGLSPITTYFEDGHGYGGGRWSVMDFVPHWDRLWKAAGNATQWRRPA